MLNKSEQFVKNYIQEVGFSPTISKAMMAVNRYMILTYEYESKDKRVAAWFDTNPEVYDLVISIFTVALTNKTLTYQAMVGMLNHKIKLKDTLDRVKTIAEVIAVVSKSGLINIIKRNGDTTLVKSGYNIDVDIPVEDKHEVSMFKPQTVTQNKDEIQGSMLLGGSINHHDDEICLDHINRMNAIPLSLNFELLRDFEELPTFSMDTQDKVSQWKKFKQDCLHKYVEIIKRYGNRFFLDHKFCTRGRTHAIGYHINSQGTSFKKAIVQLYKKELVRDTL